MRAMIVIGLGLGALGACGGSGTGDTTPDAYDGAMYNCAADTRPEQYSVGDEHMGANGLIDVKLLSANPAPPARGDNSWVVQIASLADNVVGAPMTGLEDAMTVTPYMPDHQHGSPILVQIAPVTGMAGQYTLDPVNLWMPGYWETTITVHMGSGSAETTDHVVYKFCLSE